ncbi:hypothetical protein B9T25_07375 [Acinetobacter sp. ANC 4470]|uniref:hypothetical protein n=1 Tax=Acinetobacter sp. ANC 4470 TaxID=1977881 RepID=UPI000A33C6E1|nr:hypothetical protein [Acinetobacter sp. ANC 4470]OTG67801.1 hypothetical protein B9T25_07375 [Acinetobacter sp. ANC 4470]
MANEKQKSLRILQPSKNKNYFPLICGILGFFTGAIFSSIVVYMLNIHEIKKPLVAINTQLSEHKILEELDDQASPVLEKSSPQQEIHNDSSIKDENLEHNAEFSQSQNIDLSQAFLHHRNSKQELSSLNKVKDTVKEQQIAAENITAPKVVLKTEIAKLTQQLTACNKTLTAQNEEKESNLLKVNEVAIDTTPQASVQITVTRTPTISKETAVSL